MKSDAQKQDGGAVASKDGFGGFPPYAYSHETPSQPLWNAEDMRDYAKATLARFEQELEKQRLHFFNLQDPRAESIYYAIVPVHEAIKAALNPPNAELSDGTPKI